MNEGYTDPCDGQGTFEVCFASMYVFIMQIYGTDLMFDDKNSVLCSLREYSKHD